VLGTHDKGEVLSVLLAPRALHTAAPLASIASDGVPGRDRDPSRAGAAPGGPGHAVGRRRREIVGAV
jgi:hypothetical protein